MPNGCAAFSEDVGRLSIAQDILVAVTLLLGENILAMFGGLSPWNGFDSIHEFC